MDHPPKFVKSLFSLLLAGVIGTGLAAGPPVFDTPDRKSLGRGAHALKKGFPEDAVKNFQQAARYGNKDAQFTLGMMYVRGLGVEMDWAHGSAWLELAASHGNPEAIEANKQVREQLKPEEVRKAQQWTEKLAPEFGNAAAVERRETWIRKERRKVTGSRTGRTAAVQIQVADATGYTWQVAGPKYFELLEGSYILAFRQQMGEVTIGELKVLEDEP
ncbi:MAG: hypothetical protein AAF358_11820 [Pseudomonadota bacterium]